MLTISEMQTVKNDAFFDELIARGNFKNDAALCRVLRIAPPSVSNMRRGKIAIGPALLVRIHETLGVSFKYMRQYVPAKEAKEKVAA